ncbi:MAG: hypothetical protein J0H71_06110 [Rhizobiales bacterium]|nr:hypothetical protein [Hyphomicrobiales bacterium]
MAVSNQHHAALPEVDLQAHDNPPRIVGIGRRAERNEFSNAGGGTSRADTRGESARARTMIRVASAPRSLTTANGTTSSRTEMRPQGVPTTRSIPTSMAPTRHSEPDCEFVCY